MNLVLRKAVLAGAVAGALGLSAGVAQAFPGVVLGAPGNAVLIPYVLYDSAAGVDTAIGITTVGSNTVPLPASATGALHWYFFNNRSCHEADSMIPATTNDFVGFMWSDLAKVAVTGGCTQAPLNGMKGYMIVTGNEATDPTYFPTGLTIYGDAAMIQGAWTATAFIPTISLLSSFSGGVFAGELSTINGYPHVVFANYALTLFPGDARDDLDLRYYVKDLGKRTDLVYWTNRNSQNNASDAPYLAAVNVFNEDEVGSSNSINLSNELNVITLTDTSSPIGFVTSYKSGFITVNLPLDTLYNPTEAPVAPASAVAFSMIYTPNGGAQTVLAHHRLP